MIPKRVLFTGYATSHLTRYITYAIELGATVLHVGYATAFRINPPAAYRFVLIDEASVTVLRAGKGNTPEQRAAYQEAVTREAALLTEIAADFAPDLCHVMGADIFLPICVEAGLRPLVVSALGYVEHWVYHTPRITSYDKPLLAIDLLLVEPPMLVEVARNVLPASVRVEELSIGLEGRYFYPVDPAMRATWRRALNVAPEATVIFSPRGWGPSYGHGYVLEAFAKALPDLPAQTYLFFTQMARSATVDVANNYFEGVRQRAEELGIAQHVRWLPIFPTVSMATLYNAADLIISYRAPDTFPVTVLEAMACARPVLSADLPTFANSVIAEHCRLAPPENSDALASAIIESVQNPPSAEALEIARQAVLSRYDKAVILQKLATLYASLISSDLISSD